MKRSNPWLLEIEMMSHLTEIDVIEDDDIKSGYTITFTFEKNAFFTNDKIVKKYHMTAEGAVENSTTKFDWKPVSWQIQKNVNHVTFEVTLSNGTVVKDWVRNHIAYNPLWGPSQVKAGLQMKK